MVIQIHKICKVHADATFLEESLDIVKLPLSPKLLHCPAPVRLSDLGPKLLSSVHQYRHGGPEEDEDEQGKHRECPGGRDSVDEVEDEEGSREREQITEEIERQGRFWALLGLCARFTRRGEKLTPLAWE